MVAEDEEINFLYIQELLEEKNFRIILAKNGIEAVDICKSDSSIELILMDIKMPVMDGYEAVRKIREFDKDVVIIAQTALALVTERQKALSAGCNDYLTKPIKREDLFAMIEKHLGNIKE